MRENPDLSIVIVSWNVASDLKECLESIESASKPDGGIEVIVIDNASSDGTLDMLQTAFPMVRVLANSYNLGFSAANNQGIALSHGRYVLVLNPDTVIERETLVQCLDYLETHSDVGLLGCRVVYPDGMLQFECARNFPSLRDAFLESLYLHRIFPKSRLFGASLMTYWDHSDSREVPCILGAFMLLRRRTLEEIGVFDTSVPMYLDDIDLCYRIARSRWLTFFLASVQIMHKGGRSEAGTGRDRDPLGATARYAFFMKHHGRQTAFVFRMIILFRGVFRLIIACTVLPMRLLDLPRKGSLDKLRVSRQLALIKWVFTHKSKPPAC